MSSSSDGNIGLGLSPKTVKNIRGYISMALNYAVREELLSTNPASHIRLPRSGKPKVGCFTYEEMQAFTSVKDNYEFGNAFSFDLVTGLRPEELFALTPNDVDLDKCTLRIERACVWIDNVFKGFGPTKTKNSDRTIDITEADAEFLRRRVRMQEKEADQQQRLGLNYGEPAVERWINSYRKGKAYLYPHRTVIFGNSDGQVPSENVPRRWFKAMLRGAGFKDYRLGLRLYDLRHTHASYLLMSGVPPVKVAERLGHTVGVLHEFYEHIIPDLLAETPSRIFAKRFTVKW